MGNCEAMTSLTRLLHIFIDCFRNVLCKKLQLLYKWITSLFLNRFWSNFHCSVWIFNNSFYWINLKKVWVWQSMVRLHGWRIDGWAKKNVQESVSTVTPSHTNERWYIIELGTYTRPLQHKSWHVLPDKRENTWLLLELAKRFSRFTRCEEIFLCKIELLACGIAF